MSCASFVKKMRGAFFSLPAAGTKRKSINFATLNTAGMKALRFLFFFTLLYIGNLAQAFRTDSLEVGLLTCSPGSEVYSLYGHTAIRMKSCTTGEDWVFNYGMFSFSRPHFIWRFTKGECDYQIGVAPYAYFAQEYEERGSSVYQQTLNLTAKEKQRLWDILVENMRPENRVYRYNFLYDNCTTRARDRIEDAIDGEVVYPASDKVCSFREIIHQYTSAYPWAELGNDICLGAAADRDITVREEMFAPFNLLRYADGAVIRGADGSERPLVLSKSEIVKGRAAAVEPTAFSPAWLSWLLFACVAGCTVVERLRHACYWGLDVLVMLLAGGIGLVVTFLFFFSVHPTVGTNWQIWVFNPIPLLAMPWVVYCGRKRRKTCYHLLNAAVLILFMIFSALIPQDFCVVVVPLALALLLRSCSYLLSYREKRDKE